MNIDFIKDKDIARENKDYKIFVVFILMLVLIVVCLFNIRPSAEKYVVLVGEDSQICDSDIHADLIVIDGQYFSSADITKLHNQGCKKVYSYLNIGSIETFRDYYSEYEQYTLGDYENWPEERWIDVSNQNWQDRIISIADGLIQKGVDGFFIDNIDVYYYFHNHEMYEGIQSMLEVLHGRGVGIIVNGGEIFVREYLENSNATFCFEGINQESIYTCYNFKDKKCGLSSGANREYYEDYLDYVLSKGLTGYCLEYSADANVQKDVRNWADGKGYVCYISNNIELKNNNT